MATTAAVLNESAPASDYARLEERILARDQKGASDVLYRLMKQGRPLTEITRETVRIHAPYTHVPYHQRLDDGIVKFVNNDHCLSERAGRLAARVDDPPGASLAADGPDRLVHADGARSVESAARQGSGPLHPPLRHQGEHDAADARAPLAGPGAAAGRRHRCASA